MNRYLLYFSFLIISANCFADICLHYQDQVEYVDEFYGQGICDVVNYDSDSRTYAIDCEFKGRYPVVHVTHRFELDYTQACKLTKINKKGK